MDKINLYLIDMSEDGVPSGVTRYLENLLCGLSLYPDICVYRICLLHSETRLLHTTEKKDTYLECIIPLPERMENIIDKAYWNHKYNTVVYELLRPLFEGKKRILIHIHTLNLIYLALYIKEHVSCRIITHLHCIPWKGLYNRDVRRFNRLYEIDQESSAMHSQLVVNPWELPAYTASDRLICVTRCGRDFLSKSVSATLPPLDIIPNGIEDYRTVVAIKKNHPIELIYVGVLSPGKGLNYILEALRVVKKQGYDVRLNVAGKHTSQISKEMLSTYIDLDVNWIGNVPFETLASYYAQSDIGIIASLQEQASYVAIEMAMFGLAIITTAIDGLDETFTDEKDALKVGTSFSKVSGLRVNVDEMASKIIVLARDCERREQLGHNARKLYEEALTLECMTARTVAVYNQTMEDAK